MQAVQQRVVGRVWAAGHHLPLKSDVEELPDLQCQPPSEAPEWHTQPIKWITWQFKPNTCQIKLTVLPLVLKFLFPLYSPTHQRLTTEFHNSDTGKPERVLTPLILQWQPHEHTKFEFYFLHSTWNHPLPLHSSYQSVMPSIQALVTSLEHRTRLLTGLLPLALPPKCVLHTAARTFCAKQRTLAHSPENSLWNQNKIWIPEHDPHSGSLIVHLVSLRC